MKLTPLFKALVIGQLASNAFAINPVMGKYVGLGGGVSYTPNLTINHLTISGINDTPGNTSLNLRQSQVKLEYQLLGNIFGQFGYRQEKYRIEAEIIGTANKLKNVVFTNTQGQQIKLNSSSASGDKITFKGQTSVIAVLANAFYQFYTPGQSSQWVPYVGLGAGVGSVDTSINLNCNMDNWTNPPANCNGEIPGAKIGATETAVVGQAAVGASYFMDDYSTIYIDYRYITTGTIKSLDHRFQTQTLNFGFNFSLENLFGST